MAVLVGATVVVPAVAQAQDGPGLTEIVVTAQKREESLQKIPVAIDVVSGAALEARGIATLNDLTSGTIPAIRAAPFAGRPTALVVGMRGVVPSDATQMSRDNGVGIYIDGVNLGRVQGLGTELFELERVEVLKGPQGTLFGRNAVGGAISIISKAPTGQLGLRGDVGASNFGGFDASAHLDLPAFANVATKIDAVFARRDGTVENPVGGQADYDQYKRYGVHAIARWTPAPGLRADLSVDASRDESTPYYGQLVSLLPGAPALAPLHNGLEDRRMRVAPVGVVLEPSVSKVWGISLNAEWDVADATKLRSITAYRSIDQTQYDNSGLNFTAFRPNGSFGRYSFAGFHQWQFSQELQLVGSVDRLSYVAGFYYFHERGDDTASAPSTARYNATGTDFTLIPNPFVNPAFPSRASDARARSTALFGQFTYTPALMGDRLHLTLGGRYTWDRKTGALTTLNGALPVVGGVAQPILFNFRSGRFDPMVNLAVDLSDDIHGYLKWSRAYRAGGANSRSANFTPFGEEVATTSEIGLKSELLDRRLRINLAAYRTRYSNLQVDFSNPANPSNTETRNTGAPATIKGVEADITAKLARGLSVNVNYAYTHVNTPPQLNPFTGALITLSPVLTPEHAVSGAIDYEADVGPATLRAHVDAMAQGESFSGPTGGLVLNARTLVNARLGLEDIAVSGGKVGVAVWVRNLSNARFPLFGFTLAGTGLINGGIASMNAPRTFGIDFKFNF